MKQETKAYRCETCQKEFSREYPVAESRDEYEACRKALPSGYVVNDDGHARKKIPCPGTPCRGTVLVTILVRRDK